MQVLSYLKDALALSLALLILEPFQQVRNCELVNFASMRIDNSLASLYSLDKVHVMRSTIETL